MKQYLKIILNAILYPIDKLFKLFLRRQNVQYYFNLNPNGQNRLVIKGGLFQKRHQIPPTVYFNTRSGEIIIGKNTVFGENVMVLTGKHASINEVDHLDELHKVPEKGRDIIVGKNSYIGSGAIIIGPVTIGEYTVIGAGAVVTKDLPDCVFAAGNPAKVIKSLGSKIN
jgi:acetyltransferase-like isoleucine patch superfamily enzyme